MNLSAIYVDMDGVLVDLVRHTYRVVLPEELIDRAHDMTITWDSMHTVITELTGRADADPALPWAEGGPFTDVDLYKLWADGGQEFWATVPWLPLGKQLLKLCSAHAPVVLMTTPTWAPSCSAGKVQWITENVPEELRRRYALTPCKHHMAHAGALLVDDGEHNITAFQKHGGNVFLWPGPWNGAGQEGETHESALSELAALLEGSDWCRPTNE